MDFSSCLKQLASVHERECEKRHMLEQELQKVRHELDQMQKRSNQDEFRTIELDDLCTSNDRLDIADIRVGLSADIRDSGISADVNGEKRISAKRGFRQESSQENIREFAIMNGWQRDDLLTKRKSTRSVSNKKKTAMQERVAAVTETQVFDILSLVCIVANSVLIGAIAGYSASNSVLSTDIPIGFVVCERIFTVVFLMELLIRGFAYRREFFFGKQRAWNWFDLVVVGCDVVQTVLELVFSDLGMDLSLLRILRIARVTRLVRVIKVIRFFKELRMMIYSILRCGTSLLWSLILFFGITYIFGIFLMSQVTDYLIQDGSNHPNAAELKHDFSSVFETTITLYACMSGGVSWKDLSDDLHDIHWTNACALAFYVFFTLFVVSNILTGIFVDTAIQSASNDREEVIQEQMANSESELMMLKTAFEEADEDESGYITFQEFQKHLDDPTVRAHFKSIGVEVHQAFGLFKLLDQDHSGEVGIEEFVMGFMRLKGGAKGVDLATLMYENKRLVEHMKGLELLFRDQFSKLEECTKKHLQIALNCRYDPSEVSFLTFNHGRTEVFC